MTVLAAWFNKKGFSQHLAATQIWLLRAMGQNDRYLDEAARRLASDEPLAPFFVYLHEGPTKRVRDLLLSQCPVLPIDVERHVGKPVSAPPEASPWWKERQTTLDPGSCSSEHFSLDASRRSIGPVKNLISIPGGRRDCHEKG